MAAVPTDHTVVVVAFDGLQLLDLAGPVEVFRTATRLGATRPYRTLIATARRPSGPLRERRRPRRRRLARRPRPQPAPVDTLARRRRASAASAPPATGRSSTTSRTRRRRDPRGRVGLHRRVPARRRRPARRLRGHDPLGVVRRASPRATRRSTSQPDRIYVRDRDRWTSAGVTAGIDLVLAIVEHDHGAELAHEVAGWLVVFVRRPGGQSQFSAQLRRRPGDDARRSPTSSAGSPTTSTTTSASTRSPPASA